MSAAARSAYIDSLRAIAALLVVWTHSAETLAPLAGGSWLWDVAKTYDFGRIGVVAFFGVSGLLIPKSLDASRPDAGRAFAIRRFFRLFPAFWLSIPLGVLIVWTLFSRPIAPLDIALNFTMIPDAFQAQPVMGLYWTLEYELAFYAACLLLFKTGLLARRGVGAGLVVILMGGFVLGFAGMVVLRDQRLADLGLVLLNLGVMFLGALWRQHLDGELGQLENLVLAGALALIWLVVPAACAYAVHVMGSENPFFIHFPVSYAAGTALFIVMTSIARVEWRPLAWVGLASYSLYLLHPLPIYAMRFAFEHGAPGAHLPTFVLMLIATALSLLLAGLSFRVVEQPAIDLGRRISRRATPRDA